MELTSNFKTLLIFCFLIYQAKSISENEMEEIITKIFESQEMQSMKSQLEVCTKDREEMVTVIQDHASQIESLKLMINQSKELNIQEEIKTDTGKTLFKDCILILNYNVELCKDKVRDRP